MFAEPGSGWTAMTQTAKLTAIRWRARCYFGYSVSINGNTVAVGNGRQRGTYVYTSQQSVGRT